MNPDEKCGECKYFVGKNEGENAGECHKYAPRPSPRPKMQIEGRDLWANHPMAESRHRLLLR